MNPPTDPLPCPFCGGEASVNKLASDGWFVWCRQCRCRTAIAPARAKSVELWNCRQSSRDVETFVTLTSVIFTALVLVRKAWAKVQLDGATPENHPERLGAYRKAEIAVILSGRKANEETTDQAQAPN